MRKKNFNKITAWLMVICMLAGMLVTVGMTTAVYAEEPEAPWDGEGTEDNPYKISSAAELISVSDAVYAGYWDDHFKLIDDINLSGINWTPIGDNFTWFTGTFDGNGKTISNLTINNNTLKYVGLFGSVGIGGKLNSIRLENINISSSSSAPNVHIGGLAGENLGDVSNSSSSGSITGGTGAYVGGLLGYNYGNVDGSSSTAGVTVGTDTNAGGLMGANIGTVEYSYSTGEVEGGSGARIGGLIGDDNGTVEYSYSTGEVEGGSSAEIGGLIGYSSGIVQYSYSTGDVTGGDNASVGGLAGYSEVHVSNSYSAGKVHGGTGANVGGFVGVNVGYVSRNYYNDASPDNSGGATPLTIMEMKQQESFSGWNFDGTWKIGEHISYPTLQWQPWTADEEITADRYDITWYDIINNDDNDMNNITKDLSLPGKGAKDSDINWSVSPDDGGIDINTGAVTRPIDEDKTVTLTATISKNGGTDQTKVFELTIKKVLAVWKGDGTSPDTAYQVESAAHLDDVRNKMGAGVYFKQTVDITLSGDWMPIGDDITPFAGTFDGNGKTISGLTIDNGIMYTGLFGRVDSDGILNNISLDNVNISSSGIFTGSLAGLNAGNVMNCSSNNSVINGSGPGGHVGGLIGYNYGNIVGSSSNSSVTGEFGSNIGGLAGWNYGTVSNSYSTGSVADGDGSAIGRLIGFNAATIVNCYSSSSVAGGNHSMIGGLLGSSSGTISSSYYLDNSLESEIFIWGEPKTAEEMKQEATFITRSPEGNPDGTWDFENTWRIIEGYTYPVLRWQSLTTEEINAMIDIDANALTWDIIKDQNDAESNVTSDLVNPLPTEGANGTTIEWSADPDEGWIDITTGVVTRPTRGEGNKTVVLTAAISKAGGTSQTRDFTLTIKAPASKSSGGTPVQTPVPTPTVDPNGNIITAPKLDKNTGVAATEIDTAILTTALEKAAKNSDGKKTVEIAIPTVEGAKAYEPTLPASILSSSGADIQLKIKTDIAAATLPGNMLTQGAAADAKNVSLTIAQADVSGIDNEEIRNRIGDRPVIQLNLKVDGKSYAWSNENAPVKVSIPYKPTTQELADPEHITVWYIDGKGNVVEVPPGRYDSVTGTVTFSTTHFSHYAVAYVTKTFNDLSEVAWAKKPIEVLASKGILKGITETAYAPQTNITRADFLYFLVRTLGVDAKIDGNFDDISRDAYYYKEIAIAKKLGITSGTGNNKFNPDASITRQDMMVLTENALRLLKKLEVQGNASDLEKFADKSLIAAYAVNSMASVVKEGLIVGSNGRINPLGNTTRAEAAAFLYKIYNK